MMCANTFKELSFQSYSTGEFLETAYEVVVSLEISNTSMVHSLV